MKDTSPWGPRHASEPTHDKTYDVAAELRIHPMQAYGHISAFRGRILTEAPRGRLRGGALQVERLALWDGTPGALAAAFVKARIVDVDREGNWTAHDHAHYGGASIAAREAAVARTEKWRKGKKGEGASGGDVTRDVTRDVSGSSSLLSSPEELNSDRSPDPESGGPAPEPPQPVTPRAMPTGAPPRTRGPGRHDPVVGYPKPATVDAMLAYPYEGGTLGQAIARQYPGLPQKGLQSLRVHVEGFWAHYERNGWPPWPHGVISKLSNWMRDEEKKILQAATSTSRAQAAGAAPPPVKVVDAAKARGDADWRRLSAADPATPLFHVWWAEHEATYRAGGNALPAPADANELIDVRGLLSAASPRAVRPTQVVDGGQPDRRAANAKRVDSLRARRAACDDPVEQAALDAKIADELGAPAAAEPR